MKIVNEDIMFTLNSVDKKLELENAVKLELNGNPFLPRDFNGKEYSQYQLIIYGLKNQNDFIKKISEYVGELIDVEELENKKLDFWSDAYQIGEFEFEKYEEIVKPFEKEDWVNEHKSLVDYFYKQSDLQTKNTVRWRKFIDNLEFFLKQESKKSEMKNEFLKDSQESINANKKAVELSNRILNLIEQYKTEENGS
jgi:hypothetical protein